MTGYEMTVSEIRNEINGKTVSRKNSIVINQAGTLKNVMSSPDTGDNQA